MSSRGNLIVVKFGGKTLSSGARIKAAVEMVAKAFKSGVKPVVVVSAIGDTTDRLIRLAEEATEDRISPEDLDDVLSMGERVSARIFASTLRAAGLNSTYLDPSMDSWPIITDDGFGNAEPILDLTFKRIREVLAPLIGKGFIPVIPGFIGKTADGRVTTLGRGGSDVTALLLGSALGSDEVILVSDVNGVMTGDPKLVSNPRILKEVDVKNLVGLADSGVKFIKSKALKYKPPGVKVKLISFRSGSLEAEGTVIRGSLLNPGSRFKVEVDGEPVAALTVVGNKVMSRPGVLAELLKAVGDAGISPLGMSTNSDSVILYIPENGSVEAAERAHSVVLKNPETLIAVALKRGLTLVKVKGVGLEETPGVISLISSPLKDKGINIHGMLTITSSVVLILDRKSVKTAIKLIEGSLSGR